MAASAQVEPENTDMLAAIHDDLGVGGHDWNDLLPAHGQSPKAKGKAKQKQRQSSLQHQALLGRGPRLQQPNQRLLCPSLSCKVRAC